jgi:hypothetical protein
MIGMVVGGMVDYDKLSRLCTTRGSRVGIAYRPRDHHGKRKKREHGTAVPGELPERRATEIHLEPSFS